MLDYRKFSIKKLCRPFESITIISFSLFCGLKTVDDLDHLPKTAVITLVEFKGYAWILQV
jgi:hypothetical protein